MIIFSIKKMFALVRKYVIKINKVGNMKKNNILLILITIIIVFFTVFVIYGEHKISLYN